MGFQLLLHCDGRCYAKSEVSWVSHGLIGNNGNDRYSIVVHGNGDVVQNRKERGCRGLQLLLSKGEPFDDCGDGQKQLTGRTNMSR